MHTHTHVRAAVLIVCVEADCDSYDQHDICMVQTVTCQGTTPACTESLSAPDANESVSLSQ